MGHGPYTPPAKIVKLRKEKSLLPALYADNGDFILLDDKVSPEELSSLDFYDICRQKELIPVYLKDLPDIFPALSQIVPWGWDHAIIRELSENGVPQNLIPTKSQLEELRRLSHRRTTIPFRTMMAELLDEPIINMPEELRSVKEIETILQENPLMYFKAPWSSSGRGIVVSDHITRKGLLEWCHGVINHQGSVMAEKAWMRIFDFATEWEIKDSDTIFLGVSVFETSSRGKYHGNINLPQEDLYNLIKTSVPHFNERIIKAQQQTIQHLIAPFYNGFLGIDMLADQEGNINPCVELNLRLTMGHVALKQYRI